MPKRYIKASIISLALVCSYLALAGCAEQGSSTPFYTSRGQLVQSANNIPPAVDGALGPYDGVYQGTANAIFTGAGRCISSQTVTNFDVRSNVANWAGYTGSIDASGEIEMHRGFQYLSGRFARNRFGGRLETGAYSNLPSCVYTMKLVRVGA